MDQRQNGGVGGFTLQRRNLIAMLGGAVVVWALPAFAQQKPMPVIGYLGDTSPYETRLAAFRQGLSDTGWVEGRNVAIEYRWAEGRYDELPAMAADLIDRQVDVIVAPALASIRAAKNATSTIPIAFITGDPIGDGVVASLARPGGNLTGVSILAVEINAKRLELLSELIPQARVMAFLVNPEYPNTERKVPEVLEAARAKGIALHIVKASTEDEIDAGFVTLLRLRAGALIVDGDPFLSSRHEQIIALATRNVVPAIYTFREAVASGGLLSYGPSLNSIYRQLGLYTGRILKGEKPADLPVQQPTTFELVINLKSAKALGLTVPESLLQRVGEVIE